MGFMPGAGFAGLTVHLQHEWDFSPLVVITLGDSEEPSTLSMEPRRTLCHWLCPARRLGGSVCVELPLNAPLSMSPRITRR
jgi:hypothetical protein